jgi:hypothetical protein
MASTNCLGGTGRSADPLLEPAGRLRPLTEPRARENIRDDRYARILGETGSAVESRAGAAALGAEARSTRTHCAFGVHGNSIVCWRLPPVRRIHKPELRLPNILASARVPVAVLSDARRGARRSYIDSFDKRLPPPQYSGTRISWSTRRSGPDNLGISRCFSGCTSPTCMTTIFSGNTRSSPGT